jgi:hypothetical protein
MIYLFRIVGKMAFRVWGKTAQTIETKLRSLGTELVSREYTCWSQFYYQQLDPADAFPVDKESPVFTMVGVQAKEFLVCEAQDELVLSDNSRVPSTTVHVSPFESRMFEKMNVFNLIRKTVKRIKFVFKHFRRDGMDVLINEDVIIILNGDPASILGGLEDVKSLSVNLAFVRPKWNHLEQSSRIAFWIYQLTKQTERVFPVEVLPKEIEFKDCLIAKNLLLV